MHDLCNFTFSSCNENFPFKHSPMQNHTPISTGMRCSATEVCNSHTLSKSQSQITKVGILHILKFTNLMSDNV